MPSLKGNKVVSKGEAKGLLVTLRTSPQDKHTKEMNSVVTARS